MDIQTGLDNNPVHDVKHIMRLISRYRIFVWVLLVVFILFELTIPLAFFTAIMSSIEGFYIPYLVVYHIAVTWLFSCTFRNTLLKEVIINENAGDHSAPNLLVDVTTLKKKLRSVERSIGALTVIIFLFNPVLTDIILTIVLNFFMPNSSIEQRY